MNEDKPRIIKGHDAQFSVKDGVEWKSLCDHEWLEVTSMNDTKRQYLCMNCGEWTTTSFPSPD